MTAGGLVALAMVGAAPVLARSEAPGDGHVTVLDVHWSLSGRDTLPAAKPAGVPGPTSPSRRLHRKVVTAPVAQMAMKAASRAAAKSVKPVKPAAARLVAK